MNKRHWVSVRAGEALSRRFVRELVVDSYRLVLEKLPRSVRPVDPETYGAELPAQRVGPGGRSSRRAPPCRCRRPS